VLIEAGCRTFDGEASLAYARTRSDSDDYMRMTRQREVQQALLAQADPLSVLQNFQSLTETGAKYIYTDIPQDGLGVLIDVALRASGSQAETIELVPPRFNSVNPPFDQIRAVVKEALGE